MWKHRKVIKIWFEFADDAFKIAKVINNEFGCLGDTYTIKYDDEIECSVDSAILKYYMDEDNCDTRRNAIKWIKDYLEENYCEGSYDVIS